MLGLITHVSHRYPNCSSVEEDGILYHSILNRSHRNSILYAGWGLTNWFCSTLQLRCWRAKIDVPENRFYKVGSTSLLFRETHRNILPTSPHSHILTTPHIYLITGAMVATREVRIRTKPLGRGPQAGDNPSGLIVRI